VFARWCGSGLLVVALFFAFFAVWARIDTLDDLYVIRLWDIGLGFLCAIGLLLHSERRWSSRANVIAGVATWVCVSGAFLLWHQAQVQIRWTLPKPHLALNRVRMAEVALLEYARDCGGFPPDKIGLTALHANPGVRGWAGPYLRPEDLTDPWGHALEYRVTGNRAEVWSNGPDGTSGTEDDIPADVER
jgi:hypothetical protein